MLRIFLLSKGNKLNELELLVKKHQAKANDIAANSVDWGKRKEKWLAFLGELNELLRSSFISAGIQEKEIKEISHRISEEKLGDYDATGIKVKIGNQEVEFLPIASVIIGGYGRVDVVGPAGEVKLIAADAEKFRDPEDETPSYNRNWKWLVYPGKSKGDSFLLESANGLANMLKFVLNAV